MIGVTAPALVYRYKLDAVIIMIGVPGLFDMAPDDPVATATQSPWCRGWKLFRRLL